ncbi:MAG: translational GTPase TypA [Firmicutes bacterium]|nr:translational GTPase TypA [Bacillota bacterium]
MIRNIAIIAHVDHGKTTLVDGLMKQSKTFRHNESAMSQTLILDSNDQERERGITILAKNTAIDYKGTRINIIDTPGHADFGGEVERTLSMAEGALLLIDAHEGPMPQTKFVLKKALEQGLKVIVVINKIDKQYARVEEVIGLVSDLFLDLATDESQLEFPIYYAIGRDAKAWKDMPADFNEEADLSPLFDAIIEHIPEPPMDNEGPLQLLVSSLDWDFYQGKYCVGKIRRGIIRKGMNVVLANDQGIRETAQIASIYVAKGLKRAEVDEATSGDIVSVTGLKNAGIGDTICDPEFPDALPGIKVEEPTLKMFFGPNTSPFAGREGQFVTGRQLLERIQRELETNVAMKLDINENGDYIVSGRGELHLSVFIETLRREGYEMEVGRPQVITKEIHGVTHEPVEELTVNVDTQYVNNVIGELCKRKAMLILQEENDDGTAKVVFEAATRSLLGLRSQLLTISRGTAVMNSIFMKYAPMGEPLAKMRNGALIASETGRSVAYGLNIGQAHGALFIDPQTDVYAGMVIGLHAKEMDLEINVIKEKKATNMRSTSSDSAILLTPPTVMSLETCLDFLEDDELLEVTPNNLRLRKKILDKALRFRAEKNRSLLKDVQNGKISVNDLPMSA